MSNGFRTKKMRSGKWVFLIMALVILGGLALLVYSAKDEAELDKMYTFEGNAQRVGFLNKNGLIVEPDPVTEDIVIPAEFNGSYNEYNELQKSQGFDLLPYAGQEVTKYTYNILNYPDYPENVVVNLIFDDHRLIAADITYNDSENGFTKPLINGSLQNKVTVGSSAA